MKKLKMARGVTLTFEEGCQFLFDRPYIPIMTGKVLTWRKQRGIIK